MRRGQVVALALVALVPLTTLVLVATVFLGAPVIRTAMERRAQAVALAGAYALATGSTPAAARRAAAAQARVLRIPSADRMIEVEGREVAVVLGSGASKVRIPGARRALELTLSVRAKAYPITTQDGRPGAALRAP